MGQSLASHKANSSQGGDAWLASALGNPKEGETRPEFDEDAASAVETKLLSSLIRPSDASVFKVLRARFAQEDIYTYGALKSLVVCNPFRPVPCLEDPSILPFYKACLRVDELEGSGAFSSEEPHIWAACRDAWGYIRRTGRSVSFVIQGESGAGKTETAKHVMLYFSSPTRQSAARQGRARSSSVSLQNGRLDANASLGLQDGEKAGIHQIMMSANPVTEALGNARTLRNDNSSRFGRFVKLFLNAAGEIESSEMSIYSLEKSRVVLQAQGERNFHVFYQLLRGVTQEQRQNHKLRNSPQDYVGSPVGLLNLRALSKDIFIFEFRCLDSPLARSEFVPRGAANLGNLGLKNAMLRGGGILEVEGMDDASDWHRLLSAFGAVGADDEQLSGLLDVLSATLLCGEVQWVGESHGGEAAVCSSPETFEDLAALLGVQPALLEVALSTKKRKMPRGSIVSSPLTPTQAAELTQSIARSLYEALFLWAVRLINTRSRGGAATSPNLPFAGVLDIFGFEAFKHNSLEQLFINYCNERLHQFFIEAAFKREQAMCEEEGITITLKFQDNAHILAAIDCQDAKLGLGILPLLEEQCGLQAGSNEAFTQSCHRRFGKSPAKCYVEPKMAAREHFEILHSCCPVRYNTNHFREKNMDIMPAEVVQLLLGSSKAFVRETMQGSLNESAPTDKPKKGFIAAQLLRSVSALFTLLRSSEPKFVKCVKSNKEKKPMVMEEETVISQLHTLSIIESLQTERQGFTYKKLYKEFLEEHTALCVAVHGCLPFGPTWQRQVARRGGDEAAAAKAMTLEVLAAVGPPGSAARRPSLQQMARTPSAGGNEQQRAGYAVGSKRVFLTSPMQERCEFIRRHARKLVDRCAAKLQATFRAWVAVRRFQAEKAKLIAMQARWRRYQGVKDEVQKRRRKRQLRGLWRAAAAIVYQLSRHRREMRLKRRRRLVAAFRASGWLLQLLGRVRSVRLQRRAGQLRAKFRAVSQFAWCFKRVARIRQQRRTRQLIGALRASGHLLCSLHRVQLARWRRRKRHLRSCFKACVSVLMLHAKIQLAKRRRRQICLRGCWRASAMLILSGRRSWCRSLAAIEIQRHIRTFLQRDTLRKVAKVRGQRLAVRCFRGIMPRYDAQVVLARLRMKAAAAFFKDFTHVMDARGVLLRLRAERNARMIQTISRGMLCRRQFRALLTRRRANASRELKAYLEAARCRLKFAEFRRCEGYHKAGLLLSETKSLNILLGHGSRYTRLRTKTPPPPSKRAASLRSIKEVVSPRAAQKEAEATVRVPEEVVKSLNVLRSAAGSLGSSRLSPRMPRSEGQVPTVPQLDRGHYEPTNAESQPEPEPRADRTLRRKVPARTGRRPQQPPQPPQHTPSASAASIAGTSCKSSSSASMPLPNHGPKSFPRQPQTSRSHPTRSSSQATPPRKTRAESSETMPETPHSSSTCVRKASPTSSSSRFTDRLQSSAEAASLSAPVQLRAWLERARQEASALYTSGALNGLRSPDRGRSRRSLSPGSTLHLESGNISIAGEEVVDPRIEMFAHPRSLSPSVRDCTIRGSALGDPGLRSQRMARPSRRQQRSADDMTAPASSSSLLDPCGAPDRSSSSFGEAEAFAPPARPGPSPPGPISDPWPSSEIAEAPGHGTGELVAEPVTRTGLPAPAENRTEEACFRHEALLQSQLLTTQQQLEELQRQYLEVQQLLRERAPRADVAGPTTPREPRLSRASGDLSSASPQRAARRRSPQAGPGTASAPRTGHGTARRR